MTVTIHLLQSILRHYYVVLQFLYPKMTSDCFCQRCFGKIVSKLKTKVIQSILTLLLMI